MLLESVTSASKRAEELLNSINDNKISTETPIQVEDHFTGLFPCDIYHEAIIHTSFKSFSVLYLQLTCPHQLSDLQP